MSPGLLLVAPDAVPVAIPAGLSVPLMRRQFRPPQGQFSAQFPVSQFPAPTFYRPIHPRTHKDIYGKNHHFDAYTTNRTAHTHFHPHFPPA